MLMFLFLQPSIQPATIERIGHVPERPGIEERMDAVIEGHDRSVQDAAIADPNPPGYVAQCTSVDDPTQLEPARLTTALLQRIRRDRTPFGFY